MGSRFTLDGFEKRKLSLSFLFTRFHGQNREIVILHDHNTLSYLFVYEKVKRIRSFINLNRLQGLIGGI